MLYTVVVLILFATAARAQSAVIDFESDSWQLINAEIQDHLGRQCLAGAAVLKDVEFENGVIEVDVAVDGSRSYPGIIFRMQSNADYERFYIRPHRAGLYPDALQYTPVFKQVAGWQLYNGPGYTAAVDMADNEWVHVKMEVQGTQARVYMNGALKHGVSRGTIGVLGPNDGTACFSDFKYTVDDDLSFEAPAAVATPAGTITDWEISRPFKAEQANRNRYPRFYTIFGANWQKVTPEASGLVDIARYAQRTPGGPDLVLARTKIRSDRRQNVMFSFGYSDEVDLFLNGHKVFAGNSSYQYRDPSFLGIVGFHDAVNLTLEKGLNEIFMMVTETFGGWGIMGKLDGEVVPPLKEHGRATQVWATDSVFLTPESVLYDPDREVLYVTNFDAMYGATEDFTGYISKLSLDGEVEELKWITGLNAPAGIAIYRDKLYTLERGFLTEIDIARGEILERYEVPGSDFVNDLAIDGEGNIYISDTSPSSHIDSRIYRFKDGVFQVWLDGPEIYRSNGLFIHENELLVGNTGDGIFKAVDLTDKTVRNITSLGAGVIDGIRVDNKGNYIVSHWEGQTYVISPSGEVVEVLDTMGERLNSADFEYIREQNLLLIPTFLGNRVTAYRLAER
jgi:sugar lactone lactonase YvrE